MLKVYKAATMTNRTYFEVMQVQNLVKGWPCSYTQLSLLLLVRNLHLYFLDRFRVYRSKATKVTAGG